jgi:hypothetical protein
MTAALLGAGQIKMVAQCVEQGRPRRHLKLRFNAIDSQRRRSDSAWLLLRHKHQWV